MGYFDEFQRAGGNTGGERYFDEFKNQPPQDSSLLDKAKGFLNSIDDANCSQIFNLHMVEE